MSDHIFSFDVESMYPYQLNVMKMVDTHYFNPRKGYKGEWVIDLPYSKRNEIITWCREHFGEPGNNRRYNWRATWPIMSDVQTMPSTWSNPRIFLRRESDVTMFMLKWSGNGQ